MARTLGRPRRSKVQKPKGRFVIITARKSTLPDGKILPEFMLEEDESVSLFDTRDEALSVGRTAVWANAWAWFVVELSDDGEVVLGTRTEA